MEKDKTTLAQKPAKLDEPKYPLEKLRGYCFGLFNVSPTVFTGATKGMTGEYTVEQIKNKIDAWLKGRVVTKGDK